MRAVPPDGTHEHEAAYSRFLGQSAKTKCRVAGDRAKLGQRVRYSIDDRAGPPCQMDNVLDAFERLLQSQLIIQSSQGHRHPCNIGLARTDQPEYFISSGQQDLAQGPHDKSICSRYQNPHPNSFSNNSSSQPSSR